ncbi:type II toxin-antitoxin system HicA family toxin [Allofustis seminis]|uniref:type II toxin-antitoxin system HicA family toxin n=1 Tax=Allofustis seminis TaxID=166939 RepID=UPI00036EC255|nr:type II toxin-antitoxin system HicA family toxin [Allofustis seminis]
MKSRDLIKLIQKDGWYKKNTKGSHHHFIHPTKKGKVTIPHPRKDIPMKTVNSILEQAGLKK